MKNFTLKAMGLLLVALLCHGMAMGQVTFTVGSGSASPGSVVEIPVTVTNFSNVTGLQMEIDFPDDKATFIGINNAAPTLIGFSANNFNDLGGGKAIMAWFEPTFTPASVADGTVLFTISMQVTAADGDQFTVGLSNLLVPDQTVTPLPTATTPGTIDVTALTFIAGDTTTNTGTTIDLPVTARNFTDVAGFQFKINYSPGKATFVELNGFNPALTDFSAQNYFEVANGNINVLWDQAQLLNTTIADDEVLFNIRLMVNALPVDTININIDAALAFDNQPVAIGTETITGVISVIETTSIAGEVYNEAGESIGQVAMALSGDATQAATTGPDGLYAFNGLAIGSYTVTPTKNINITNGLNVADILFIRGQILGFGLLTSPYKLIAADVDFSNSITVADIILLRRLILGSETTLAPSWRFVPQSFAFPDPLNPFGSTFPESLTYTNLVADQLNQDFIGVKVGDVNNGHNPAGRTNGEEIGFAFHEQTVYQGGQALVPVYAGYNYTDIVGWQGTLQYNPEVLTFRGYQPAILPVNETHFGVANASQGQVGILYYEPMLQGENAPEGEVLFFLLFDVHGGNGAETDITINAANLPTAIYNSELNEGNSMAVRAGKVTVEAFETFIYPNPGAVFTVAFDMPVASQATITVYNNAGQAVLTHQASFDRGRQQLELDATELQEGTYYLEFNTGQFKHTQTLFVK